MKLSVIIPVYNEEKTILEIVRKALSVELPNGLQREVIIVNDGSDDGTLSKLNEFKPLKNVSVITLQTNQGKTAAVKKGIEQAQGDLILIQDADLEYTPDNYKRIILKYFETQTVIYGSRFLGEIRSMSVINCISNIISNITFSILFLKRMTDINTCFKLFPSNMIKSLDIKSKHFGLETEVSAKLVKRGIEITEVPIEYRARTKKEGKKISWPKALNMYWGIIKYRFIS